MTKNGQVDKKKQLLTMLAVSAFLIVIMILYHLYVYPLQDLLVLLGR